MVRTICDSGSAAHYLATFEEISAYLNEHAQPGDVVVAVGSGNVCQQAKLLVENE